MLCRLTEAELEGSLTKYGKVDEDAAGDLTWEVFIDVPVLSSSTAAAVGAAASGPPPSTTGIAASNLPLSFPSSAAGANSLAQGGLCGPLI